MIVLLPLRGWAGDVMGIDMTMRQATHQQGAAMPPDCPMNLTLMPGVEGDEPLAAMQGCGSCELCIPVAEAGVFDPDIAAHARHAKPACAASEFLSVTPAPSFKPPVS